VGEAKRLFDLSTDYAITNGFDVAREPDSDDNRTMPAS